MPVYSWKGIDSQGRPLTGILFAHSYEHLEGLLSQKEIGLVHARAPVFSFGVTAQEKYQILVHLASLLRAHIQVHDALLIMVRSTKQSGLKTIIADLAELIAQGVPLSEALEVHALVDDLTKAVVTIGERTGDVGSALQNLVDHKASMASFKAKLRSALIGPFITFTFFLVTMVGMFLFVIPRFEYYFLSYDAPLPLVTNLILMVSRFMRSSSALSVFLAILSALFGVYNLLRTKMGRSLSQGFAFKIPFVGLFLIEIQQAKLLKALGMLLTSGVPLSQALSVCCNVYNEIVKNQIAVLKRGVDAGQDFSVVWGQTIFASAEIEVFLSLGESSGRLAPMIEYAAEMLRCRVYARMNSLVTLVHPVLILFLGLCIAALIFAVYTPIITLSSLIV